MIEMNLDNLEHYLQESLGGSVKLRGVGEIGALDEQAMKEFGYGKALKVTYEKDGREEHVVFSTMRGDRYGHQFYWDRAAILMFEHEAGKPCRELRCPKCDVELVREGSPEDK